MPGPLPFVRTITASVRLDARRVLNMGPNATLSFYTPDETAEGGMRLIRTYDRAFNRMTAAEREIGDGKTVIFDIADVFDEGQLPADLYESGPLYLRVFQSGVFSEYVPVNTIPRPEPDAPQIYRITGATRTGRQTFFSVGR